MSDTVFPVPLRRDELTIFCNSQPADEVQKAMMRMADGIRFVHIDRIYVTPDSLGFLTGPFEAQNRVAGRVVVKRKSVELQDWVTSVATGLAPNTLHDFTLMAKQTHSHIYEQQFFPWVPVCITEDELVVLYALQHMLVTYQLADYEPFDVFKHYRTGRWGVTHWPSKVGESYSVSHELLEERQNAVLRMIAGYAYANLDDVNERYELVDDPDGSDGRISVDLASHRYVGPPVGVHDLNMLLRQFTGTTVV